MKGINRYCSVNEQTIGDVYGEKVVEADSFATEEMKQCIDFPGQSSAILGSKESEHPVVHSLVCISEALQPFDHNLSTVCFLVLAPVVKDHEARRHDEVELCASNSPNASPISRDFLLHENCGCVDASDRPKPYLETGCHPELYISIRPR
jgi:hypothetical protein